MKKYKIITYGCQMNVHESEKIAGILKKCGYIETNAQESADLILFNTCCIRDTAEKRALGNIGALKPLKKQNKDLIIAVMGCMTQQDDAASALKQKFPFVDIILGTSNLHALEEAILQVEGERQAYVAIDPNERPDIHEDFDVYRTSGTNAWLNIMYGCNNFCTYCIVPYVRGRERSRKPEKIKAEFEKLLQEGYREITLLGQNVNSYGKELGTSFAELLKELDTVEGDYRIRFMTSHPKDFNLDLIEIMRGSRHIAPHIHLPVQAGSNAVLTAMNRGYTREDYLNLVDLIRKKLPDCGITTDIMVGFPGEREEDFLETLDLVKQVGFSNAFTFIYSPRKGTKAAEMPQIEYVVKRERIKELIKVQNQITKEISKTYEGKRFRVLCEDVNPKRENTVCGRTDCGRLVNFNGDRSMIGKFFDVEIKRSQSASLFGVPIGESV